MLYHLFEYLEEYWNLAGAGLFKFITFRSSMAIILSLVISMAFGKRIIDYLQKLQVGETIRDLGLEGQMEKAGTPTMGGIIIVLAILIPTLLLGRLDNIYIQIMILSTVWMFLIGFIDDYIKVFRKNKDGMASKFKILGQVGLGLLIAIVMLNHDKVVVRLTLDDAQAGNYEVIETFTIDNDGAEQEIAYVKSSLTNIPFFKGNRFEYRQIVNFLGDNSDGLIWIIFIPVVIFIVTAVSNGANLTDGIDGLATGVSAIIGATLGVLAYLSGNLTATSYLNILNLPGVSELAVYSAGFLGACVGFLWYNAHPAEVFMGDTGSLTLGGIIAAMAILIRKEFLIPILCGVFLIENLSVVMQVSYFKYTRRKYGEGRRIFLMSPLHHHYQKKGMHESKIVTRFWIVGIMLAVLTIVTLKIR
ncbi:MAG: phospho-N-acetylmuramoyl-pentapeptide-transferase [Bacteroidia bacterium]|nr:phospho-N-acetylmuramoyl-pentapeptide-transferase [Bacteroidia bacterium]